MGRAGASPLARGSASRPSTSTSSHSLGCTLRRNCCSPPRSWACQCSSLALPIRRATSGRRGRSWGETLVSSSRSGATPANSRSRSMLARPWSTALGSRPRSSRARQVSITLSGSAAAIASASSSSSCSGTAPSSSHTAIASIGAGNRLSWSNRLSASRNPPWARWATTVRASPLMPIPSCSAIQRR